MSLTAGQCGRCGASYEAGDRRAQLQGPAICRQCHLDPARYAMPIAIQGQGGLSAWLGASAQTVAGVLASPLVSTRAIHEPVRLSPWVAFLLTLAAPSWLTLVLHQLAGWAKSQGPRVAFTDPRWLDPVLGAAGVDALFVWTLAMLPLGLLSLFFCAGTLAHLLVLLTGHSSRTLGATLAATAMSWVPLLLICGPLQLALCAGWVGGSTWLWGSLVAGLWSYGLLALGLSRAHHTALVRGMVAAPLPWLLTMACLGGSAGLAMKRAPWIVLGP